MAQPDDAAQPQAPAAPTPPEPQPVSQPVLQPVSQITEPVGNPYLAMILAWLVPGLGHIYVRRTARGIVFFLLVLVSLWVGCALQGNLYQPLPRQPLAYLGTAGAMGAGIPYFILRYGVDYSGDIVGAGYEYGTAFLLTAGLMNWLLILDAWDISRGKKE